MALDDAPGHRQAGGGFSVAGAVVAEGQEGEQAGPSLATVTVASTGPTSASTRTVSGRVPP
jgi:hypothetical protein